jgi:hypothetical protein
VFFKIDKSLQERDFELLIIAKNQVFDFISTQVKEEAL